MRTNRINVEPTVIFGCSQPELGLVAGVATPVALAMTMGMVMFTRLGLIALPLSCMVGFGIFWVLCKGIAATKNDKPDGWYSQFVIRKVHHLFALSSIWVPRSKAHLVDRRYAKGKL
jgi:conjugative transfer region protein (TIGR03750 family)